MPPVALLLMLRRLLAFIARHEQALPPSSRWSLASGTEPPGCPIGKVAIIVGLRADAHRVTLFL